MKENRTAEERLARLLKSETIKLVDSGSYTPKHIDNTLRSMRKEIEKLRKQHSLDQSEIVRLRRYVEFLIGHDNTEV